jgi:TolA-binding protein
MFRFTIRDLLWFMVMVGIQGAWMVDRRNLTNEHYRRENQFREASARFQMEQRIQIEQLKQAKQILEAMEHKREQQERIRKIQNGSLPPPEIF